MVFRQCHRAELQYASFADRSVHDRQRTGDGTQGVGNRYVWIWQGRRGLLLYDREADTEESLPWRVSRDIEPCSQGGIWAFSGGIVYRLWQEDGHIVHEQVATVPDGTAVSRLHESPDALLWVATDRRLYSMSLAGRQLQQMGELPSAPLDMSSDRQGRLFLAMGTEGLFMVQAGQHLQRINSPQETFLSVTTVGDGSVWASTLSAARTRCIS